MRKIFITLILLVFVSVFLYPYTSDFMKRIRLTSPTAGQLIKLDTDAVTWINSNDIVLDSLDIRIITVDTIFVYDRAVIGESGGSTAIGLDFQGTYTGDIIDFTDTTVDHTGSGGPCLIRAGTYASPISNADEDQSGFIRLYGTTSADGTSYDRGIFACLTTSGAKGVFPIAGLAEVRDGGDPKKVQAAQFISHLNHTGATLSALGGDVTAGMYGAWLKITANAGATTESGSRAAPVWLDNQLYGSNINAGMEEYAIFSTAGGTVPDAWAGFETTSSGWAQLFHFDETAYDQAPISNTSLKVLLNATQYYLPLSSENDSFTWGYPIILNGSQDYGIDMNSATLTDAELRGSQGELWENISTDGIWTTDGGLTIGDAITDPTTFNGTITSNQIHTSGTTVFYFRTSLSGTSGEHNNLRARAQSTATSASTSDIKGVYGQGIANAGKYAGAITGVFANAIVKNTATATHVRGTFIEAETEGTPTAVTNLYGAYIRTKVHLDPTTDYYGLMIDNEKMATGYLSDAYIGMKSTTWGSGASSATYGIDMNGIEGLSTADIRGHEGEIIFNDPDGTWDFGISDLTTKGDIDVYDTDGSSRYWHEYNLPASSASPGASGATYIAPSANSQGGYQFNANTEQVHYQTHVEADWDGSTDMELEIIWQVNEVAADDGTVDLKAIFYYSGDHEATLKTQTVEVAHTITGNKAQFTQHKTTLTINWDLVDHVVQVDDTFGIILNLETDTSECDDIIINYSEFKYETTKPAPETD